MEIIHTSLNPDNMANYLQPVSVALCSVKN